MESSAHCLWSQRLDTTPARSEVWPGNENIDSVNADVFYTYPTILQRYAEAPEPSSSSLEASSSSSVISYSLYGLGETRLPANMQQQIYAPTRASQLMNSPKPSSSHTSRGPMPNLDKISGCFPMGVDDLNSKEMGKNTQTSDDVDLDDLDAILKDLTPLTPLISNTDLQEEVSVLRKEINIHALTMDGGDNLLNFMAPELGAAPTDTERPNEETRRPEAKERANKCKPEEKKEKSNQASQAYRKGYKIKIKELEEEDKNLKKKNNDLKAKAKKLEKAGKKFKMLTTIGIRLWLRKKKGAKSLTEEEFQSVIQGLSF